MGWPLEEGVSEVRGAEGSGEMSSGVAGECRYLRSHPPRRDSPHLGTVPKGFRACFPLEACSCQGSNIGDCPQWLSLWKKKAPIIDVI